jgi:hypothetical protein
MTGAQRVSCNSTNKFCHELPFVISRCEIAEQGGESDAEALRGESWPGLASTNSKSIASSLRFPCRESSVVRTLSFISRM